MVANSRPHSIGGDSSTSRRASRRKGWQNTASRRARGRYERRAISLLFFLFFSLHVATVDASGEQMSRISVGSDTDSLPILPEIPTAGLRALDRLVQRRTQFL